MSLVKGRKFYKPLEYPFAFEAYTEHEAMHWLPSEVKLGQDVVDWNTKLTESQKSLVTHILRYFTQGDISVAKAYNKVFIPAFAGTPEVAMMLNSFASREAIHVDAYDLLNSTLGFPDDFHSVFLQYDALKAKNSYLQNYLDGSSVKKMVRSLCVYSAFTEGLALFSSFAMLFNFERLGLLPGLCTIVRWSQLDESKHVEGMVALARTLVSENYDLWTDDFKQELYKICRAIVKLEDRFIDLAFELGDMENLTNNEMKQYNRYIADLRLMQLGLKPNYNISKNPLPWMEHLINSSSHDNFFETTSTEYSKIGYTGERNEIAFSENYRQQSTLGVSSLIQ